jgi:hypothetical protein
MLTPEHRIARATAARIEAISTISIPGCSITSLQFLPRLRRLRCCRNNQVHQNLFGSLDNERVGALATLQCSARYLALRVPIWRISSQNIKPDLNTRRGSTRECKWPAEPSNSQGDSHLAMKPRTYRCTRV